MSQMWQKTKNAIRKYTGAKVPKCRRKCQICNFKIQNLQQNVKCKRDKSPTGRAKMYMVKMDNNNNNIERLNEFNHKTLA